MRCANALFKYYSVYFVCICFISVVLIVFCYLCSFVMLLLKLVVWRLERSFMIRTARQIFRGWSEQGEWGGAGGRGEIATELQSFGGQT
jgi:hypothetical protein